MKFTLLVFYCLLLMWGYDLDLEFNKYFPYICNDFGVKIISFVLYIEYSFETDSYKIDMSMLIINYRGC